MKKSVFGKTMDNVKRHRNIRVVTTNRRRRHLRSEPNYRITKWFSENLLVIIMNKTEVKLIKLVYL